MQFVTPPYFGNIVLNAGPAQFGHDLKVAGVGVFVSCYIRARTGLHTLVRVPLCVCISCVHRCRASCWSQSHSGVARLLKNANEMKGKIGIVERGDCMFIDKVWQPCFLFFH